MNRLFTICAILLLFPILLFAQWPTEPLTGLRLSNTSDRYERFKASCPDGEGGYFICIESQGRLYINHIDLSGNLRWPIDFPPEECFTDSDPGFEWYYSWRGWTVMTHNPRTGETWVAWQDYRNSYRADNGYDPTSSEVYLQKFDSNRVAQLNNGEAVLVQAKVDTTANVYSLDERFPLNISVCQDNSVLLIFADADQDEFGYDGNLWAQRISQEGEFFWEYPGKRLIPDNQWGRIIYPPNKYFSDGADGFLFSYDHKPLRVLPSGELAWEYGSIEIERIATQRDYCEGFDNTIVIIGGGWIENGEQDHILATVIDTSGNFIHGPTSIGNPEDEFPAYYINSLNDENYGIIGLSEEGLIFYKRNISFSEESIPVVIDSFPRIYSYPKHNFIANEGYRVYSTYLQGQWQDTHHEIWGWDVDGNHVFTFGLDEEPNDVSYADFWVDDAGNTWCIWMLGTYGAELYANIVSPDGQWGLPLNDVSEPGSKSILPSNISISVYPNPGNGQFNVSYDLVDPSPAKFIVSNVLGQRIHTFDIPGNVPGMRSLPGYFESTLPLDLSDQASGTYFLQVRTESGQVQQRRILLLK